MSAGGVFTLIANEGRTDRLLLATALLNQRITDIQCARRRAGKDGLLADASGYRKNSCSIYECTL